MALAWGTSMDDASTFCAWTRGWVKAVFTEALAEEVEVELVQPIGSGDHCCEFLVSPRPQAP
jgi:predicted hydrocarbon binding protein